MEKIKVYVLSFISVLLIGMFLCACSSDSLSDSNHAASIPEGVECQPQGAEYQQLCKCVELSPEEMVMEGIDGNLWAWTFSTETEHEVFYIGESVIVTMLDCGTENVTDDVILAVA